MLDTEGDLLTKSAFTAMMSQVLVECGKARQLLLKDADLAMGLLTAPGGKPEWIL